MTVIAERTPCAAHCASADAIKSGVRCDDSSQDEVDSDRLSDVSSVLSSVGTSCLADDERLELSGDDEECASLASSRSSDRGDDEDSEPQQRMMNRLWHALLLNDDEGRETHTDLRVEEEEGSLSSASTSTQSPRASSLSVSTSDTPESDDEIQLARLRDAVLLTEPEQSNEFSDATGRSIQSPSSLESSDDEDGDQAAMPPLEIRLPVPPLPLHLIERDECEDTAPPPEQLMDEASVSSLDLDENASENAVEETNALYESSDSSDVDDERCSFSSDLVASSVSSLAASVDLDVSNDDDVSSIASSIDDRHCIENVPVLPRLGDEDERLELAWVNGILVEIPQVWEPHEYVKAKAIGRHYHSATTSFTQASVPMESTSTAPIPTIRSQRESIPVPLVSPTAEMREMYVPYASLHPLVEAFCPDRSGLVLDVGCGASAVCRELVLHGYSCVCGIDVNSSAISKQQQLTPAELRSWLQFRVMDASKLDFQDESCSCIVTKATLDCIAGHVNRGGSLRLLLDVITEIIRCLERGSVWISVNWRANDTSDVWIDEEPSADNADGDRAPMWRHWRAVESLLARHLELVYEGHVGQPRTVDGTVSKPYEVIVWRRRESARERQRRLIVNVLRTQSLKLEYDAYQLFMRGKREQEQDETRVIHELRAMIQEDATARRQHQAMRFEDAAPERRRRRESFFHELREMERREMAIEDQVAASIRQRVRDTVLLVTEVLASIIDSAVENALKAKQQALTEAKALVTERVQSSTPVQQRPNTAVASAEAVPCQDEYEKWIQELVSELLDTAQGSIHSQTHVNTPNDDPSAQSATTTEMYSGSETSAVDTTASVQTKTGTDEGERPQPTTVVATESVAKTSEALPTEPHPMETVALPEIVTSPDTNVSRDPEELASTHDWDLQANSRESDCAQLVVSADVDKATTALPVTTETSSTAVATERSEVTADAMPSALESSSLAALACPPDADILALLHDLISQVEAHNN